MKNGIRILRMIGKALALACTMALLSACGGEAASSGTSSESAVTDSSQETTGTESQAGDPGTVQTTAGLVRGSDEDGVYRFLGIPYAQAVERFVPASEVTPWDGIFEADSYGKISYQDSTLGMSAQNGSDNDNNALNLNIWTPGTDDGKRPVMVWLHGGGFSTGSANESSYDGENLCRNEDVVVVGINHRLNAFGHLDLSAYDEKYQYSANVGIIDIQMALGWIQENIENFGGDPDNVTLFGQSGGGAKILTLMTTPYAEGLFQKAIIQSGATEAMGVTFTDREISQRIGELTLQNLGIDKSSLEEIQNVPYEDILEASDAAKVQAGEEFGIYQSLSTDYGVEWEPVVEGDYLPTNPVTEEGFAKAGKDVTLLIGSNFSEWTHWMPITAHTDLTEEQTAAFEEAYPDRDPDDAAYVDTFIRLPMLKIMSHKADQGGAPVYAYLFNYGSDPYHGAEIPYVFENNSSSLAGQMGQAWANFARNGVPSADGMPEWEAYTRDGGATMLIDETSELVHHHDQHLMQLLEPDYTY